MTNRLLEKLRTAQQLYGAGRLLEAETMCRQILCTDHQRHEAVHLLGVIACKGRRFEEGHRLLSAAIALEPRSVEYRLNYGLALNEAGCWTESENVLGDVIGAVPDHPLALNNLGNAVQMQGRLHEALEYYHRALQSDTDYFDARVNLAAALRTLSRQKEALSELQIVFAKSPNHVGALFQRANLLADDRRIAEAEQIFQLIRIRQQRPYDLRHSLQDRFARSTLGNPSAFAKEIEAAYDTAWSSAVTGHRRIGG